MESLSVSDIKQLLQEVPPQPEKIALLARNGISDVMKPVTNKLAACIAAINLHEDYAKASEDTGPMPFIWITGEQGVGKRELVYRIHELVEREHIYEMDCESLDENPMRWELFGYPKGVDDAPEKTGAGKFWAANVGLLSIFEPQRLPRDCQDRLLTWQRFRQIRRGGNDGQFEDSDPVIIFVARQDPEQMAQTGAIERGLVMNSLVHIHIPPLRDRPQDVALLIEHSLRTKGRARRGAEFSFECNMEDEALFLLVNFHWPDNVTALREIITHLVSQVLFTDFNHKIAVADVVASLEMRYDQDVLGILVPLFRRIRRSQKKGRLRRDEVWWNELQPLRRLWDLGFFQEDLANRLGISRFKLSRELKKAELDSIPQGRPPKNARMPK